MTEPLPMRQRILAAAVKLFAERGFDATTVQEVVTAAGVTKGALYHHFASKDELLYELYRGMIGKQNADLTEIVQRGKGNAETVRDILVNVVQSTVAMLDEASVFFREAHKLDAEHMSAFRADRRLYHKNLCAVVESGQRAGEFADTVPADTVVQVAMGVVNQLPVWYRRDGDKTAVQLGHEIADFVLAGLRP